MNTSTTQRVRRTAAAIRAILLSVVAGGLSLLMVTPSSATVISADHLVFGIGSLTRDTDQGLDFLDLTLSINRSFNDVATHFVAGGDFAGFRHANEDRGDRSRE